MNICYPVCVFKNGILDVFISMSSSQSINIYKYIWYQCWVCSPTWWVSKRNCIPLTSRLSSETSESPRLLFLSHISFHHSLGTFKCYLHLSWTLETKDIPSSEVYQWTTDTGPHKGVANRSFTPEQCPSFSLEDSRKILLLHHAPNHAETLQIGREMSFSTVIGQGASCSTPADIVQNTIL